MYPFDTVKTFLQSFTAESTSRHAANEASMIGVLRTVSFGRLWRGVQAMAIGCIPAHAMYFSSYEMIKEIFLKRQKDDSKNLGALGSSVAGAAAALSHDAGTSILLLLFRKNDFIPVKKLSQNTICSHGACGYGKAKVTAWLL